jgi:molecular chaperone GrpE
MATDPDRVEPARPEGEADSATASAAHAPEAAAESAAAGAATAADADVAADDAAPTDPVAERDAARQQANEYLTLAQRAQADLQNFRRRAEQERTEAFDRGREKVVLEILPVLDDFERALAALPVEQQDAEWTQGIRLIERKLRSSLESLGVERIVAEGEPFDPWNHEAVLEEPREDVEPGRVTTVARQGYRLGTRVLRPAQVVVAKQP